MFSAADPAGSYLAVSMEAAVPPGCSSGVPIQVGSFTANAKGNLSTTNTYENMPNTAFTAVNDMKISPAGTVLAVARHGRTADIPFQWRQSADFIHRLADR
jgi:hypothetical protein